MKQNERPEEQPRRPGGRRPEENRPRSPRPEASAKAAAHREQPPVERRRRRQPGQEVTMDDVPRPKTKGKKAKKPEKKPAKKKKPKLLRMKNPHLWRNVAIAAAIAAAIFFTLSIFFKIDRVEVTGNSYYTAQQIIEASGIQPGDNLLATSKAAVTGNICQKLPYVRSVQVRRELPDLIILQVEETDAAYAVTDTAGGRWLISCQGRILGQTDSPADYLTVGGLTITDPVVGQQMTVAGENAVAAARQAELAGKLLQAIEQSGLREQITGIEVPGDFRITCWLGDQYKVIFGDTDQFEERIAYLEGVLAELDSFTAGEIDLTFTGGEQAVFRSFR